MASICNDSGGRKRILFVAKDGRRRAIRLGKVAKRLAESIKLRVEALNAASIAGHAVDDATSQWLAGLDDVMLSKLAAVGLTPERDSETLGAFSERYLAERALDMKPASLQVWQHVEHDLRDHFGNKPLRSITPDDAAGFKSYLLTRKRQKRGLSDTTVSKRLTLTKQLFRNARQRKLIPDNPFADVRHAARTTTDRQHFIDRQVTARLLDKAPNADWRCVIALCRFGGLRCPSEVLSLEWPHIDWERLRITVPSPKTENHGKASREIPLFPELVAILQDAWDLAPERSVYVIQNETWHKACRGENGWKNSNLRTTFQKIVKRAGLDPWPRLFHNLRASRETELVAEYPIQVVTAWLGNTPTIALKHYLQVTPDHFEKAAQNPAHNTRANECKRGNSPDAAHDKTLVFPGSALHCTGLHDSPLERRGFEPPTSALRTPRSPS